MTNQKEAEKVFARLEKQLEDHPCFTGIELAAMQKDGVYTDDLCVRILVNAQDITHEKLNIPRESSGVVIEVQFVQINLQ